jgi:hypothetical protein
MRHWPVGRSDVDHEGAEVRRVTRRRVDPMQFDLGLIGLAILIAHSVPAA